ncbi:MAG: Asp23/Gls24 family envelope stress response protein [Clostridiaceae bacterium]|nr:Asp23/Gls24 family envelope stress response protein [Clostridiaceae bacterium]
MEISGKQGKIKIAHDIVMTIARHAAEEVEGITSIKGGLPGGIGELFSKNTSNKKGIKIQSQETQVVINLSVVVKYGTIIPEVIGQVQEKVKSSIESMTDIQVSKVNVFVQDIEIFN